MSVIWRNKKAESEWERLQADLQIYTLPSSITGELPAAKERRTAVLNRVEALLDEAKEASTTRVTLLGWWNGQQAQQAWLSLHEAEAELATELPEPEVLSRLPRVIADARRDIGDDEDSAIREATSLYYETYAGNLVQRPAHRAPGQVLGQLIRRRYAALDERNAKALNLRNRILMLASVATLDLLFLLIVGALGNLKFSLSADNAVRELTSSLTMLWVIIFGITGGLISTIPTLVRPKADHDSLGLLGYQAALKMPLGGLFAVVGCIALQSGTLPGVTGVTSLSGLLFWAAAFGMAQQTVTRLIDQRVTSLLTSPGSTGLPRMPVAAEGMGQAAQSSGPIQGDQQASYASEHHELDVTKNEPNIHAEERLSEHRYSAKTSTTTGTG